MGQANLKPRPLRPRLFERIFEQWELADVAFVAPAGRRIEAKQASAAKADEPFPIIPVLLPGLGSDAVPVGSFLGLNTWVDLRSALDVVENIQRLVAGAQGRAIDRPNAVSRSCLPR